MKNVDQLLNDLNEIQKEAVLQTKGPVLVLAGAGSGKTRLLTYKIAYLIIGLQVSPYAILAITFTNKAAEEMRLRVEQLLGMKLAKEMWVTTFHSACNRILRVYAPLLGYEKNFVIFDDRDSWQAVRDCLKELNIDPKMEPPTAILNAISAAKSKNLSASAYLQSAYTERQKLVAAVYLRYQRKLKLANAMDFDDLLINTIKLFKKHPEVLAKYRQKFKYILIDEYQDTNPAQYQIVKLLASEKANLTVVGDEDQSIYAFRMADIRNILEFERDFPGATVIKMEQNYRSAQGILDVANQLISHNLSRKGKTLWSANKAGGVVGCYAASNEEEEANFVVREITRLIESEGYALSDFAVFYRTHAQSRVIEEALIRANLPYKIYGGLRFYERKEIKDTLAYLRILDNPSDSLSLKRIINVPKRGIGDKTVQQLEKYSLDNNIPLFEALKNASQIGFGAKTVKALADFINQIEDLIALKETASLTQLIKILWKKSGYLKILQAEDSIQAESRLENLNELISVAQEFESEGASEDLSDFLQRISLLSASDIAEGEQEGISLMTLHSAKGLEFTAVFLIGLEEGLFPHIRALHDSKQIEEERRLCYVGMTRAQKRLYLTYAWSRTLYGQNGVTRPSRFLKEIPSQVVANLSYSQPPTEREHLSQVYPGEVVWHPKFGEGIVLEVKGSGLEAVASVNFKEGTKHLVLGYAPLELKKEG